MDPIPSHRFHPLISQNPSPSIMLSRQKELGGSGGKIMASKPTKTLPSGSLKEKPSSHKLPIVPSAKEISRPMSAGRSSVTRMNQTLSGSSGKENPRPISAGRPSIARTSAATAGKENPRPISVGRASVARTENSSLKQDEKPAASAAPAIRRSMPMLPSGKFTDFRSDLLPRMSGSKERRSYTGFSDLDRDLSGKGKQGKNSFGNREKSVNLVAEVLENRRSNGCSGAKSVGTECKVADAKPKKIGRKALDVGAGSSDSQNGRLKNVSGPNLKPVNGRRVNGAGISENHADDVILIEAKQFEENCHGNGTVESAIMEMDVDNTVNHMLKDCLDLNSAVNGDSSSKLDVHHRGETTQLGLESVRPEENVVMEVKGVATANKYQSKLHEKLALLEGKVQKIALEIKQTKEMLDKNNKPRESKLVLSEIEKKICGVEKSVHGLKDGAKSESASSDAGTVGSLQSRPVVSNMAMLTGNSSSSIKSSNSAFMEAGFLPHQKGCKETFSKLNGDLKVYNGITNEKPIASEFLASLNVTNPKTESFDVNVELNHGVANKMHIDGASHVHCGSKSLTGKRLEEVAVESNEKLEEFDVLENNSTLMECVGSEESSNGRLYEIGRKISTGGWFVAQGEAILLAHDDNSCSYYDIANNEVKSEYKPPAGLSSNLWGDCWLTVAPGSDGSCGRYIVAASAGNASDSGFCSWDFYTKDVRALHVVGKKKKNNSFAGSCWYRPCGPLLISACTKQRIVNAYDIRDGDLVMAWEVRSPVAEMEFSSPLQWRSRGKAVVAEREGVTLWDVNSLNPQPILSVPCAGKKICSLHVNNTDAEMDAGVRRRASSSEVEGNDGVFCTEDSVNVFDFRIPSGAGIQISRRGPNAASIFSLKDSIFIGGSSRPQVEHFSLRKAKLVATYAMPELKSRSQRSSITQVWGNSSLAMGICGMGMFVFDAFCEGNATRVKESIGRDDDLCRPSFDYMESSTLVISRDRPAFWRYVS